MNQSLKHKIGQMIIAGFPSKTVDKQAQSLIRRYQVGNFVYFARNLSSVQQACTLANELAALTFEETGVAPFIAVDQEGGAVCRIQEGASLIPGAMALAASSIDKVEQIGENCGQVLHGMGINVNFAPVLDVNIEPKNPIIGARAFSDDPYLVSKLGVEMMNGMKRGGLICVVKHYPGHGNVKSDSHLGIPINNTHEELLDQTEWIPFKAAFAEGAEALMTSHVRYEYVDNKYPATLSYKIMTERLREKQGFKGIVITDCMEMDAIRAQFGIGEGAVLAVEAGCDMLTFSHTLEAVEQAVFALYAAVESGRISIERIDASYQRIMKMKEKHGLLTTQNIDYSAAQKLADNIEKIALHNNVSKQSMTLLQDNGGLEKLRNAKAPAFFAPASLALNGAEDPKEFPLCFSDLAAARFNGKSIILPLNEYNTATKAAVEADDYDVAVIGLYNARFRDGQKDLLKALEQQGKPLIVIILGAPYDASLVNKADTIIAIYEYTTMSVDSILDALNTGNFPGHLPVKL